MLQQSPYFYEMPTTEKPNCNGMLAGPLLRGTAEPWLGVPLYDQSIRKVLRDKKTSQVSETCEVWMKLKISTCENFHFLAWKFSFPA